MTPQQWQQHQFTDLVESVTQKIIARRIGALPDMRYDLKKIFIDWIIAEESK